MNKNFDSCEREEFESQERKLDIISLYGKDVLEAIQDKISKATGLAFVTVDYKGEPVTKMTSFTTFCKEVRRSEEAKRKCMSSDAYGAIQAAVTCKTNVYFCPCGLLEVAIPIIIEGQYLGGFIGGQVRCNNADAGVANLKNLMPHPEDYMKEESMSKLFYEIQEMDYEKFVSIADLVSLVITQLGEKEMARHIQKKCNDQELERLNAKRKMIELENNLHNAELKALKSQFSPHFLYNCLSSISNLAIIENAERTNEMTVMFAEFLRYNLKNTGHVLTISDEIKNVELYLKIQKIRLQERLKYEFHVKSGLENQKIPYYIILPFVENSILYGIVPKQNGGTIKIDIISKNDDIIITISDDGEGMENDKLTEIYESIAGEYTGNSIGIGIYNIRQRLISSFGKDYDVVIKSKKGNGTVNIIKYPKDFD